MPFRQGLNVKQSVADLISCIALDDSLYTGLRMNRACNSQFRYLSSSLPVYAAEVSWVQGGTPDFKWQGWSNGVKNKNPTKPLDRNLTPKKPNFRAITISRKHLTIICRRRSLYCWKILEKKSRGLLNDKTRKIDRKISFEYSKNPTLIKLPKQIVAKIFLPKISRNRKFPPQKNWSCDHPCHLNSGVPPPPPPWDLSRLSHPREITMKEFTFKQLSNQN